MTRSRSIWRLCVAPFVALMLALPQSALAQPAEIVAAEVFIDVDPGVGLASPLDVVAGETLSLEDIPLDLSALAHGLHRVYVRLRDADGRWSMPRSHPLFIAEGSYSMRPRSWRRRCSSMRTLVSEMARPSRSMPTSWR